jgi:hypothetical protein
MQKNILFSILGIFIGAVGMMGDFYLSYFLSYLYLNGVSESVSVFLLAALFVIAIVFSILKQYRYFGFGMFAGCILGLLVLATQLWGA